MRICNKCNNEAEYYMLINEVWAVANKIKEYNFLCLSCVKNILKRKLTKNDFILDAPVNNGFFEFNVHDYLKDENE